jgi:hypothetical protein
MATQDEIRAAYSAARVYAEQTLNAEYDCTVFGVEPDTHRIRHDIDRVGTDEFYVFFASIETVCVDFQTDEVLILRMINEYNFDNS